MKKLKLVIIISWYITNSYSQEANDSLHLRRELLQMEYRIWTTEQKDTINLLLFQKARLLKQLHLLEWSYRELNRIEPNNLNINELIYEKALNRFLCNDFSESYHQLSILPDSIKLEKKQILHLWLITLSELNKWEECKDILSHTTNPAGISSEEINSLETFVKYKSPEKAYRLSSFCPGLGQVYTNNWRKGITCFIIHAGLFYFTYELYASTFYFTGTCAGIYPTFRFYSGGKRLSYNLALAYNENQDELIKLQYQKIISKLL